MTLLQDGTHDLTYHAGASVDGDRVVRRLAWLSLIVGIGSTISVISQAVRDVEYHPIPTTIAGGESVNEYIVRTIDAYVTYFVGPIADGLFALAAALALLLKKRGGYYFFGIVSAIMVLLILLIETQKGIVSIGKVWGNHFDAIHMWYSAHEWGIWATVMRFVKYALRDSALPLVAMLAMLFFGRRNFSAALGRVEIVFAAIVIYVGLWEPLDLAPWESTYDWLRSSIDRPLMVDVIHGVFTTFHVLARTLATVAMAVFAIVFLCSRMRIQKPLKIAAGAMIGIALFDLLQETVLVSLAMMGVEQVRWSSGITGTQWLLFVLNELGSFNAQVTIPLIVFVFMWRTREMISKRA